MSSSAGSTPVTSRPGTPARSKDNPSAASDLPAHAIPGQPLCSAREYAPGPGTYFDEHAVVGGGGAIVAAVLGTVVVSKPTLSTAKSSLRKDDEKKVPAAADLRPRVSVVRPTPNGGATTGAVPDVDDVVLVRVLRINPRMANVAILIVGESNSAADEYGGIIRAQDVRETEKDKVKMQDCFRPGDIVRAQVISLGDGTNYYLSTARNDLGVVFAMSEASGAPMYPLDWRSMRCPVSGTIEQRKCARPTS
ncbi:hypothetical protein V1517DRAFT_312892 [Lipomyces orientalis]|uniref:Uncharacterized protein n=1 Tax=Lipomyces orientalis TaxID=1233043 RepID=A0ACC3TXK1_9ASCO